MMEWAHKIILVKERKDYEKGIIDVCEFGKCIAKKLEQTPYSKMDEIVELISLFKAVDCEDEFDGLLERLYNFGDVNNRLWIETVMGGFGA